MPWKNKVQGRHVDNSLVVMLIPSTRSSLLISSAPPWGLSIGTSSYPAKYLNDWMFPTVNTLCVPGGIRYYCHTDSIISSPDFLLCSWQTRVGHSPIMNQCWSPPRYEGITWKNHIFNLFEDTRKCNISTGFWSCCVCSFKCLNFFGSWTLKSRPATGCNMSREVNNSMEEGFRIF